jgi:DNA-directed RNA polymerase specialized sigma24 family protein
MYDTASAPQSASTDIRIERARRGDERAWAQLFDEHYPSLFRFFRARVSGADIAEVCAGEVFLQAFRSMDRFTGQRCSFETWLFEIAREELARSGQTTTHTVRDEFIEPELRDLLQCLQPHQREALELCFVIGLSETQAAAAMGMAPRTFTALLAYATESFAAASDPGADRHLAPERSVSRPALRAIAAR